MEQIKQRRQRLKTNGISAWNVKTIPFALLYRVRGWDETGPVDMNRHFFATPDIENLHALYVYRDQDVYEQGNDLDAKDLKVDIIQGIDLELSVVDGVYTFEDLEDDIIILDDTGMYKRSMEHIPGSLEIGDNYTPAKWLSDNNMTGWLAKENSDRFMSEILITSHNAETCTLVSTARLGDILDGLRVYK
jgi:hypothetical protein